MTILKKSKSLFHHLLAITAIKTPFESNFSNHYLLINAMSRLVCKLFLGFALATGPLGAVCLSLALLLCYVSADMRFLYTHNYHVTDGYSQFFFPRHVI